MIVAVDDSYYPTIFWSFASLSGFVKSHNLIYGANCREEISEKDARQLLARKSIYLLRDVGDDFAYKVTKV
jgi:hypothetical protein